MGCNVSTTVSSKRRPTDLNLDSDVVQTVINTEESSKKVIELNQENEIKNLKATLNTNDILTDGQKRLIRQVWKDLSPRQVELGQMVFLRIFEQTPMLKNIFSFSNIHGEELVKHPLFQAHSFRFMQIIQTAVDNLDDLQNGLVPVVLNLGRFHQRRAVWFTAQYFHAFENAMLYIWSHEIGASFTSENKNAWTVLFAYIVKWLKEGYRTGQKVTKNIYSAENDKETGEQ